MDDKTGVILSLGLLIFGLLLIAIGLIIRRRSQTAETEQTKKKN
jgi:LPXTG-motif cell wall-anchored protein